MTKMMTLLLAMEDINKNPAISLETKVTVGKAASKIGGTQVFLKQGEVFPVSKLMESMLLRSANDSAYQVAEFFGDGDVSKFIAAMNVKATELKMPGTKFYNPNGLPGDGTPDNISSPEGLAIIAEQMLKYPKIMEWSSTRIGHFREKTSKAYQMMVNTNKLVSSCPGVDGLKTGYISASGFCVTVTCKRGDRRLIAVVTGFKSAKERNHFVAKLLDWGYKRCVDIESREKQRDSSLAKSK
jgi:D-alanyl-D-alanine carboxypeptidase (penicillin-binding protein 5/6)